MQGIATSPSLSSLSSSYSGPSYSESIEDSGRWSLPPEVTRFLALNSQYPNCPYDATPIIRRQINQEASACSQSLIRMIQATSEDEMTHALFFMMLDAMPDGAILQLVNYHDYYDSNILTKKKIEILQDYMTERKTRLNTRSQAYADVRQFTEMARFQPNKSFHASAITQRWSQPSVDARALPELVTMMVKSNSAYTLQTPIFTQFLDAIPVDAIKACLQFCKSDGRLFIPEANVEMLQDYFSKRSSAETDTKQGSGKKTPDSGYNSDNDSKKPQQQESEFYNQIMENIEL
ncbi:MAG: hypothetical protein ACR2PX_20790 [Endozoicomonas sp.]|uniref:hypothetical protein n=1 Tax=Endozoicomonas sp. TaxID=1892382 RepID=UPI003D9B873F